MKATLHDVAARADVSIATVSRALNGLPVSKDAKARVAKAALALGYVANEAARALRSDRTLTIGLVFYTLANTLALELIDALGEALEDAGYSLLIASARGDDRRYDLLMHRFLERRVDGLFCIAPRGTSETLARYQAAQTPVIALFGRSGAFNALPLLAPSFSESAKAVAVHLAGLDHKRVVVVRPEGRNPALDAIAEALKAAGLGVESVVPPEAGGMRDVVVTLMPKRNRATAVVALDPQVRGLYAALTAAGLEVPRDLSIVAVGETRSEGHFQKYDVSALTVDPHRMGRAAGAAMLGWLAGVRPVNRLAVQAASFTPRASTAPRPR